LVKYTISAQTNISLTDNANNFLLVNYNGGTPNILVTTNPNDINTTTNSIIYVVSRVANTLDYIALIGQNVDANAKLRRRFLNSEGLTRSQGAILTTSNRNLLVTVGLFYSGLIEVTTPAFDTSGADTFTQAYINGTWVRTAGLSQINNTQYSLAGTLTTLPNNSYRVDYVYILADNPSKLYTILGDAHYNNLSDARLSPVPASLPTELQYLGARVGRVIIQKNASTMEVSSEFTTIYASATATLHNDLGGLNVGDYQHLTVAEKSTIFDPKTIKIAFLGDSITAGSGSTGGATSYADILNNLFSFQTYTKLGVSSATAKPTTPRPQLSTQVSAIPVGTNFITVMIGINDWSENTVIGDVNAVLAKSYGALDQNLSFSEAFRYNMETIKNNFPDAQIRVILPIKHGSGWVRDLDFKFYIDAEIQISNFLSIPVINAYDASLLAKNSPYVPDGIHPNDIGYNMLSEVVKKGIIDNKTTKQDNSFYNLLVGSSVKNGSTDVVQITGGGSTTGRFSIGSLYTSGRFTQITPSIIGGTPNIQAYLQGTGTDRLSLQGLGGNLLVGSLSDNGSGDKLQINGGISSSSRFSIGGFSAGGRFMQFTPSLTSDAPNIQGYNTGFGQDYISLQGLGGKLFIGSLSDNGSGADVQINGSIYTTSPTTSAGGYDILTRNTSTGQVEKVASSGLTNNVLSNTTRITHTGTTSYTNLVTINIPANFITEGGLYNIIVGASRGGANATGSATLNASFVSNTDQNDFIRGVQIGTGNNFKANVIRTVVFRSGNREMFSNSGGFYSDYSSIQTNATSSFDITVSNNLYVGIILANASDIAYLDYVSIVKISQ
jgi:lysophospholipase L1-like esterase